MSFRQIHNFLSLIFIFFKHVSDDNIQRIGINKTLYLLHSIFGPQVSKFTISLKHIWMFVDKIRISIIYIYVYDLY